MSIEAAEAATAAVSSAVPQGWGLEGQVILVTGAGRGLGQAICRTLGRAGASVVAADLNGQSAQSLADALCAENQQATALTLDVADPAAATAAVDRLWRQFGRVDVLINNAATDVTLPIDELTVEQWDRVVRTNLYGPFLMSKAVFPRFKERGGGQIVNIVSTAAKRTWPNAAAYHASKWGLLGLSHALHAEGRPHQIKVCAVICGGMRTPFLLDRFPDIDVATLQDPANVARTVHFVLTQPAETVVPEIMVLPMRETSWP